MSDEEKIKFKKLLKSICVDVLKKRVQAAEFVIAQAQESANSNDKSSAGDKYETGRAMGQNDKEMNMRQMNEARRELQLAEEIMVEKINELFIPGSIAVCGEHLYFMSSGLGTTTIEHHKVILISPWAPLSHAMLRKKAGDTVQFNGKEFMITEVY
jgi:hypothetical protein